MVEIVKRCLDGVINFVAIFDRFKVTDDVSMLDMLVLFLIIGLVCSIFLKTGHTGSDA